MRSNTGGGGPSIDSKAMVGMPSPASGERAAGRAAAGAAAERAGGRQQQRDQPARRRRPSGAEQRLTRPSLQSCDIVKMH